MAFQIRLYSFSKKENSTKQPSGNGSIQTGVLKQKSGIINPQIKFSFTEAPTAYNYAYIPQFGRYYFIREWTFDIGFWWASMECDVLATWKTNIGAGSEYVIRSSNTWDGDVIDTIYPITVKSFRKSVSLNKNPFENSISNGCYILGVVSGSDSGIGATTYYAMSGEQFRNFNKFMLGSIDWMDFDFESVDGVNASLIKSLFNPYQYVVSCMWFPIPRTSLETTAVASIPFGWWSIPAGAYRLNSVTYNDDYTATLPDHPQISRGKYMNAQPYTSMVMKFPAFGMIELNPSMYYYSRTANFHISVDLITGEGEMLFDSSFDVPTESERVVYQTIPAQIGVNIPISQMASNPDNVRKGIGGIIGGAIGGVIGGYNDNGGSFIGSLLKGGSVVDVVGNARQMVMPESHIVGGTSGFSKYININSYPRIECSFHIVVDDDVVHNGRPLCKVKQLSTIPGFILCEGADLNTPGTYEENKTIRSYLNGGFYYE